jgi:pimeloyl-ACP methyl ester carboxylesterase
MVNEILEAQGIGADQVNVEFDGQPIERGPQNWRWVLAMLRVLDRTPLGSEAIDAITRDVWVYVTFGGVRAKIDAIVSAAIPDEPCVVVAHSLGTIVAYNVLSNRSASGLEVPLFVTLGSPLGMRAITARLNKPLATPPRVKSWFNARDRRDVVALHPLDPEHFDVRPAIENHSGVDNFTDNRHSIDGYLADPQVARRIHTALGV